MNVLYFGLKKESICLKIDDLLSVLAKKKEFKKIKIEQVDCSIDKAKVVSFKVDKVPTFIKISGGSKPKEISRIAGVSVLVDLEKWLKN